MGYPPVLLSFCTPNGRASLARRARRRAILAASRSGSESEASVSVVIALMSLYNLPRSGGGGSSWGASQRSYDGRKSSQEAQLFLVDDRSAGATSPAPRAVRSLPCSRLRSRVPPGCAICTKCGMVILKTRSRNVNRRLKPTRHSANDCVWLSHKNAEEQTR